MALEPGVMAVTIEYGKDLKDKDLFGKQDPYCKVKVGSAMFKTKTHNRGGKNPVWNETFHFNVINENAIDLEIYDEDMVSDDLIGRAQVGLAKAREQGNDAVQAPVFSKSGKQHGFISVRLNFTKNSNIKAGSSLLPQTAPPPGAAPYPYPPQQQAAPYPYPYGAPPPGAPGYPPYPYPPYPGAPPPPGGTPAYPPPGGAPPPGAPGAYPGYPPAPAGYPASYSGPPGAPPMYGAPPAGYPGSGSAPRPPVVMVPPGHGKPHKKKGLGLGAGLALGALGGIGAGMLIGEMMDDGMDF